MEKSIEDMFSANSQFNNNDDKGRKKGKGKKILLVLILLLVVAAIVIAILMMKNIAQKEQSASIKTNFITYFTQQTFLNTDTNTLNEIFDKLKENSSESNSDIKISTNISEIGELANYTAVINTKYDSKNSRGLIDINAYYLNNAIFNMQSLITGKNFALKSDEIVTKYVGYNYENLLNMSEITENTDMEIQSGFDIASIVESIKLIDTDVFVENFTKEFVKSEFEKYAQVFNILDEKKFSQKDITLERENGNINAVAYTLTLNEDELIKFSSQLLEELKNDNDLISIVSEALESTGLGINEEMIKLFIDQLINETYELEGNVKEIYTFTIYVADSTVVKKTIENSSFSIDFDIISNDNESVYGITLLEKESNNGIKFDINRISNDVSEKIGIEASIITDYEVVNNIELELLMKGITSQKEMTIDLNFSYADTQNELDINIATEVEFDDIEIENLTEENCLFLDELTEEQRAEVMNLIAVRTEEVLMEKQNQMNLINSNTGSSVIEGQTNIQDNEAQKKEEAKNNLINAVANEMYIAEQNGQRYTVNDIADLQIEGVEIQVTIENDVATVVVDGYTFMINAAFELSE